MSILLSMSCLALKGVVQASVAAAGLQRNNGGNDRGGNGGGGAGAGVAGLLCQRFADHSLRLTRALELANERAWRALEVALAGDSWWERCRGLLARGEEKGFREQVRAFLRANPVADGERGEPFRGECLRELRAARKAGRLTGGGLHPDRLAEQAGALARFGDPARLLEAEWQALDGMALELRASGYRALAELVALRPRSGTPLLVCAVRYFFRRAVETDRELFQGLAQARLDELSRDQEAGFAGLAEALDRHGERLETLLADVHNVVVETHGDVLDIKAELQRQGQHLQELGQAVLGALARYALERRELSPHDSLSVCGDPERALVKQLVARYRALPPAQRAGLPALLNAVGKLEVVAGDFDSAQRDFQQLAQLLPDPAARAEAQYNAYRAALERRDWAEALAALRQAGELDPGRFAPFPLGKFEPERILGAGGFGVAFLCRNRHSNGRVVVKTLRGEGLERDLGEVFREAEVLEALSHPAIIRVRDCDYADPAHGRPFLVMDYFPGQTLAEHVGRHGPLSPDELIPLMRQVAEGLRAAHARGVLHRDIKPANVLVLKDEGGRMKDEGVSGSFSSFIPSSFQVKLIDFGLALPAGALKSTLRGQTDNTLAGSSIAGTLDYAAPEQMGRLKGVPVAPYSDVFGFGKTCCFALFGTPQPTFQHWQKLPGLLADLLGRCLAEPPAERPRNFHEVLHDLDRLSAEEPAHDALPAADVPPVVEPPAHPSTGADEWTEREPEAAPKKRSTAWAIWLGVFCFLVLLSLPVLLIYLVHRGSGDIHSPAKEIPARGAGR
jgi:serine/threonine protein kinase